MGLRRFHFLFCFATAGALTGVAGAGPVAGAAGRGEAAPAQLRFEERAATGIAFSHRRGARGAFHPIETMGSGLAVLDYDGDGDSDLFFVEGGEAPGTGRPAGPPGTLYRNDGAGRFSDVSGPSGLGAPAPGAGEGHGMGAVAADWDDDGDPDLLVTRAGPDLLYVNRGDGVFRLHADGPLAAPAVGGISGGWSASAAFADLDGDGDLDLYVTRYLDWSPSNNPECSRRVSGERIRSYCLPDAFSGVADRLYRNDGGRFRDVSEEAGIALSSGKGLGVVAADLIGDRLPDLYVANDTLPNFLFENLGGLRFREVGLAAGVAYDGDGDALAGMGIAAADIESDADLDLFVTNFAGEANTLYVADRRGVFRDASFPSGVGRPSLDRLGFGAVFADFDNDGLPDLCVANGHVLDEAGRLFADAAYRQRDSCFRNTGGGSFEEESPGFAPEVGRGLATADFDGDGRLDLAVSRSGGPAALRFGAGAAGRRAALRLVGRVSNRAGTGALARVVGETGIRAIPTTAGSSYLSSSAPRVWIGLGAEDAPSAEIVWPSGRVEPLGRLTPGVFVAIEGEGLLPVARDNWPNPAGSGADAEPRGWRIHWPIHPGPPRHPS